MVGRVLSAARAPRRSETALDADANARVEREPTREKKSARARPGSAASSVAASPASSVDSGSSAVATRGTAQRAASSRASRFGRKGWASSKAAYLANPRAAVSRPSGLQTLGVQLADVDPSRAHVLVVTRERQPQAVVALHHVRLAGVGGMDSGTISLQPANLILPNGCRARVTGLVSQPQWNQRVGKVLDFDRVRGRYLVQMSRDDQLSIKLENLVL